MNAKPNMHFADNYIINPTNPVTVNIIGAGGTGSQVFAAMARINHSLITLGHAGLTVTLFDDDMITEANLGRQLFANAETGLYKSVALVNRFNRFYGTNWKAVTKKYSADNNVLLKNKGAANITLSCVDTISARMDIAAILNSSHEHTAHNINRQIYWMDFGNNRDSGQVILSTIDSIKQPSSKLYKPVAKLPFITEEFSTLLNTTDTSDDTPSCSLAEALTKQDLFINSTIANMGASLLWNLFREGITANRGFFINLKDFKTQPVRC